MTRIDSTPQHVFHICPREAERQARLQGAYQPDSLASDGFIHLSTAEQVPHVLNEVFSGCSGLVLLVIDTSRLTAPLKFEAPVPVGKQRPAQQRSNPTGGDALFPHLYGPLNLEAIVEVRDLG